MSFIQGLLKGRQAERLDREQRLEHNIKQWIGEDLYDWLAGKKIARHFQIYTAAY